MYKIVKIPKDTLPYKDAKIYPELTISTAIIEDNAGLECTAYKYRVFLIKTFIPIIRNEITYLLPYIKKWIVNDPELLNNEELPQDFLKMTNNDCLLYQDKYIIPEETDTDSMLSHGFITLYKYELGTNC